MWRLAKSLIMGLPQAAFIKDLNSVYVACNSRLSSDLGLTPEDIAGKDDFAFFPASMAEKYRADDKRIMASGVHEELVERNVSSGRWRTLRIIKSPLKDEDGQVVGLLGIYDDITSQILAEERHREAESRYRAMFEAMRSCVAVYQAVDDGDDFVFVDFNRAGEAAEHILRSEIIGRRVSSIFPGAEEFGMMAVFRRVWRTGVSESFPLKHYKDKRIEGWRENFVYKLDSGEVVAIYDDLTEQKRMEAERRESQEILEGFVRYAPAVIFIKDLADRHILVNEVFAKVLGHPAEYYLGKTNAEIMPEELAAVLSANDRRVLASGRMEQIEERVRTVDGERVYLSVKFPLFDEHGAPRALCGIATDITERQRAEDERRKLMQRLDSALDSMPSAMIVVDAAGRITQFNAGAEELCHVPRNEALGRDGAGILPRLPELGQAFAAALERGETVTRKRLPMRNGVRQTVGNGGRAVHYMDIVVYPLPEHCGAVARVDDVTARLHMEEAMIQSEKLASVGGLAAGMAHEINNPLGGILQGAQNIRRRISPELPGNLKAAAEAGVDLTQVIAYMERREITKFLDGIKECGERAAAIVGNMLEFSRRSESKRAPASIPAMLDKSLNLAAGDYDLKKNYDFRKIRIRKEYAPNLPLVPCTATEIEQVVLNLLKNAAQALSAMPPRESGPEIVMRARMDGDDVAVDIEDNGPGMTEAVRRRVFEPFFTTKEAGQGTGLGLAVSYFIVTTNHGGRLRVESEPGKGTVFTMTLPAR